MDHAVEKGSVAMMYIPSFVKIWLGVQILIRGIRGYTAWRLHKPTLGK
jgi:hypothetical protein